MPLDSLARILGTIEDPRGLQGQRHRLVDILILAVIGMLWGHTDFVNMCEELKYHEAALNKKLGLPNGIPSHDTFSAVFGIINPAEFLECFISWLGNLARAEGHHIAIDGKAVRAACEKVHKGKVPYLVNAFVVETGLCIGQLRIDEKTNEIKGIPQMLEWLDIGGAVVSIDAIGCQREIASLIVSKGAEFVLPAKENQSTLHSDILLEMQTQIAEKDLAKERAAKRAGQKADAKPNPDFDEWIRTSKGHGRIERRSHYVLNDASCVDGALWPHVKSVGLVRRERMVIHRDENGEVVDETVTDEIETYIMSFEMNAEEFACYVRGHWAIENCLHWVLDDYFREDRCTARVEHATENLGLLRKIVFDVMKLDPNTEKMSRKAKQVYYRNDPDAAIRLLFQYAPGCGA
jgi:predicted transposase YbfD/YdcC